MTIEEFRLALEAVDGFRMADANWRRSPDADSRQGVTRNWKRVEALGLPTEVLTLDRPSRVRLHLAVTQVAHGFNNVRPDGQSVESVVEAIREVARYADLPAVVRLAEGGWFGQRAEFVMLPLDTLAARFTAGEHVAAPRPSHPSYDGHVVDHRIEKWG